MPKVKRSRKPPPDGWELIEPTLDELDQKMREGKPVEDECPDGPHNTSRYPQRAVCGGEITAAFILYFLYLLTVLFYSSLIRGWCS